MKNIYSSTKNTLKFLVVLAFLIGGLVSANAQVRVGFTQRTSSYTPTKKIYNVKGNFTMLGNTCLSPQNYGNNTNNNGQNMLYVDTDGNPNTMNSSAGTLVLPMENGGIPECSNIVFAGLYWTGKSSPNTTFSVTKNVPNGTQAINNNLTVNHNQNIANTNYSMSVSRGGSTNARYSIYTFTGNGNTYAFSFFNSGNPRVSLSVNGGAAQNIPVTVTGSGTWTATLNTPYVITDGTVSLTINTLIRNSGTNLSTTDTQNDSDAGVNVAGTVPAFTSLTKNFDKRVISLKGPNAASYSQFTAATNDIYYPSGTDDDIYTAYTEITDYVRANGIGQYWAADMALLEGNVGGTGYAGGWGIIVVYENSKMKYRDITIFDGYAYVNSGNSTGFDLPVAGFNTVQSGNVGIKLGVMASEGDVNFTGDYFRIRKLNTGSYQDLSHSGNSTTNFFNSSINAPGARNPQLQNNTAIDISMFDVPNPNNSVIGNSQTSTNFRYGTDGDTYSIFAIAMAVDAYIPDSDGQISAVTINGQPAGSGPYNALPGQDLEYKVQIRNRGTEAINNFKVTIPVPYNTTYVPGSASRNYFLTPVPTPNSIVYDPSVGANGSIIWDLGTLPVPAGGPDTLMGEMKFKFKVTTDCTLLKNTNCNNVVAVNGTMSGTGAITGIAMVNKSLIQGYTNSGSCQGVEIAAPLLVNVNAINYVNENCQSVPPITAFFICNSGPTIPITAVTGAFPPGSTYWSSYPVISGQTIQYTINNPFPSTVGTSTYYAIPPGVLNGCFFQFTITVSTITSQPTVTNVNYCQNAPASPLTATASTSGMTLYYYDSLNGVAQASITPSTANVGQTTYYVAEGQSLTCIGPKKPIIVTVYPAPTITAPADTTFQGCNPSAITGLPYATVATPITLAQLQTAGGNIPNAAAIGTYTLTYIDVASGTNPIIVVRTFSVTNVCGTAVTATQQITVKDWEDPVSPDLEDVVGQCSVTVTPPTAIDLCAGTITGTTTDPLTYNTQGTYTIVWNYDDGNGNIDTETQTVIVDDTIAPVVPTLANVTGECSATVVPPTTTDNCAGTITGTTTDPLTYNTQGTFTITWTFNDGNGNSSTAIQTVIVDDTTNPVIPTLADLTGQCSVTAVPPTTTDACAGTITATTNDPLVYNNQGTFVITWTFSDGNGNSINVNQNVIVSNTTPPTIPTLADVVGQCSVTAVPPTTTNSCSGVTITATTNDPLTYTTQGTYVITWSFNDGNGNIVTATQNVIVDDTTAPVVPTLANVTGECSATAVPPTTTDNCAGTLTATTNDPLTYNTQGTYTITWTFNDGNGNTSTATQTVIVDDVTAPVVPTLANVTGECSATAVAPTTTDNCAGTLTATTNDPLAYNTQGTYTITWTFNDGNGNSSTATQTVIVDDVTAPAVPQLANVTGECSATAVPPTTTDNCAGTLTATTNDPLTYNAQGTYTITWTFNDGNGNSSTATQTVIVADVTAPAIPTLADITAQCSATAVPPTTTDNCGGTITATTNDPLTYNTQGTFVIVWTFNDGNGNSVNVNQNVIIDNTVAPTIPTLADITGECSATATPPTTTNSCTGVTITATTNDPLTYTTQGSYVITWTFDDGNGNVVTATQNVIVDDVTAPAVPQLANVTGECSATAVPPTTTDNCAGTLTASTNDPLTYNTQGNYTITWTFNDGNGNTSTATQTVIVDDVTAPVVPTLADVTGECSATATPPTTTDNCVGTLTATTNDPLTYNTQGTFVITWTFNDGNGNTSTATQNVIVDDVTAPVIPALADVTGECSACAVAPVVTDNCGGSITATTTDALCYETQGTHVITWTFNDGNGNITTATQNVIVDDVTAPVIPTLADITAECTATATPPITTDNCGGTITASTNDPLTYNTQGTYVIVWTFDDGNGNTVNVNQNVIIDDVTAPAVPTLADVTGQCNACATAPTTTDNCGGTITGTTTDALCYEEQGTHVITWTFNDGNGNVSTATQNVIIDNTTPPVIPTLAEVTGECSACAVAPTTTNSCTGVTITATTTDPLCYEEQGSYVITWTFDDGNGNIVTATQNVIVDDVTAPVIPTLADVTGECSACAVAPVATDNCGGQITATTTDALCYETQGTYVITWTFNDGNGNITTATQNVIVDDVTAPVIPALADVTGECSACAVAPVVTDNCGGTITATTTDALCYETQGTHVITWTFDDGNGNITTATQNVIIDDVTAPAIPTLADVTGECSACAVAPTTTDNCGGTITATTTDALCYETQGTHVITWTFDDGNGNIVTATQNVIVDDVTAPAVPTLADVLGQCNACATPPTTTDNCGATITGTTTDALCYEEQGTFVITWTFDDGNGNVTTATQNVIIDNTTPPVIPTLADVTGECSACAVAPVFTNICTGATITATTTDPLCYETQGTFVITWTFDDGNGNIVTATQNVIVDDVTAPAIPTLADVTGECSACAVAPVATDNCGGSITATTTDALCYETQGTHVITWTFDDGNGNITTATQNVIVDDVTAPVIPALADVTGECSACAVAPTTTDNCGGTITATTTDALCYETQGTHVITWTFDDGNGNITTATQNVIVDDVTAPTIPTLADVTGECSACAVAPTTTDNCGGTITATTTDALCYETQGTHVITWTFDDGNGNIVTATQNVIVDDVTAPAVPTLADVLGQCNACATPPTTTDNCGGTITGTTTDALCYEEQGTFVITWTFDDGNGNVTTATQNVIIDNTTPPVIPTLADVTGECSACAVAPVFTNICTGATITATTTDPLCYETQGTFVITWTFDDGNGNIVTATQNVIVDDVTAPAIPTLADVTGECSACAVAPVATDNCGGSITATTTDALCYETQGTHVITWTFDDGNGNITTATQNVIVDDVTAPVIPALADVTGECSACAVAPTTTDNCGGTITATTTDALCYDTQGTHVITWTFDDGNGNIVTATQNVIIDDVTAPAIPTLADVTGECSACAVAPTTTDNCGGTITATTTDPLCYTTQGTFVITWTFEDASGNVTTATQNVIVDDVTAPIIPVLADVTGECSACAEIPTTTDNCGGVVIVGTTSDTTCFTEQGTHVITWTFDDGNGNVVTATQNVIVDDTSAPVIPTLADVTGECSVTVPAPVAIDGCNNTEITGTTSDPLEYTSQGTYVITWTFNDGNGNITTATQNVIVDDVTPPTVPTLANVTGECSATAVPPTTLDNCAGEITASTSDPLSYNNEGTYVIAWTFNDGNGNSIVVNQTVIVDDVTAPVTPVLAPITGQCSVTVPTPSTTDLCSANPILGTTTDPLQYGTIGDYIVTWTFDDGHGNTTTATQQVSVTAVGALQVASDDADCNNDEDAEFNLNDYLAGLGVPAGGSWADTDNTGALVGSTFSPYEVPVGDYLFTYTVQDGDCTKTVELTMTVDDNCPVLPKEDCEPVVHNAMSPNNDGQNDWFQIDNFGDCITANSVEIFNRWGILVFETNSYDNNSRVFKGHSEGRTTVGNEELPTGTYFYILNWTDNEGQSRHKEGYLYLSR